MRRMLIPVFLSLMALPSMAGKRITVAQLEQTLVADGASHKPDAEVARQIRGVELRERLTDATLDRLKRQFSDGSQAALALILLADRSAFLDPPTSELPLKPEPDRDAQQHLLDAAKRFALETLPRLPNLLATRTTFSFDDSPQEATRGGYPERLGLHLLGTSKAEVSVRDEKEGPSARETASPPQAQGGLVTWGEFGSTLLIILNDSAQGKTTWSHWELAPSGLVAVFHYEVPKGASHYEIATPVERVQSNGGSNRWAVTGGRAAMTAASNTEVLRTRPAYQGSLWVDPATGTIVRVSLVADLKGNPAFERGAILVEYGPVQIADKSFICPVRSLALSSAPATVNSIVEGATTEWLNENLFTGYRIFASSSRILADRDTAPTPAASAADAIASTSSAGLNAQAAETLAPAVEAPATDGEWTPKSGTAVDTAPATDSRSFVNATAAEPGTQPTTETSASVSPSIPLNTPAASIPSGGATFHVDTNAVLVPVVVRDRQGRTVDNLKQQDFQLFDDGKPRPITGFLLETHAPPDAAQRPATSGAAAESAVLPDRVTVFLFDDMHLSYEDLAYVRKAASTTLDGALTGSDMAAVVSTSGEINSGLTRNRTKLTDAIAALEPQGIYRSDQAECPKIGYYQADLIVNKRNPEALQDAIKQVMTVCNPNLPLNLAEGIVGSAARRVLRLGLQDVLTTYAVTSEIVRRVAKLPGQHTMILISSGFLPLQEEARAAESQLLNLAAQSNVAISALDARGLYTTSVKAGDDVRNRDSIQVSEFRQSELREAENAMGELADGTGGDFFHNSNDLEAGLRALVGAPKTVYVLEIHLDGVNLNGTYHHLRVKADRDNVRIQARNGYFALQTGGSKK